LQQDVETRTPYQRHNFNTTGVNAVASQLVQVETCTYMSLLRSNCTAPIKWHNKIISETS